MEIPIHKGHLTGTQKMISENIPFSTKAFLVLMDPESGFRLLQIAPNCL